MDPDELAGLPRDTALAPIWLRFVPRVIRCNTCLRAYRQLLLSGGGRR
jgi:hypothetical protein